MGFHPCCQAGRGSLGANWRNLERQEAAGAAILCECLRSTNQMKTERMTHTSEVIGNNRKIAEPPDGQNLRTATDSIKVHVSGVLGR